MLRIWSALLQWIKAATPFVSSLWAIRNVFTTRPFLCVKHINRRTDIDFVIHGGDITDFGTTKEYIWVHDIMKKLTVPYVAMVGNHDLLGHGKDVFDDIYGSFNFSFIFRGTRFIFLNTNALEFDYATPVPDFDYMLQFIEDSPEVEQTIVAMHAQPFSEQFNNNAKLMFNSVIELYKNPLFCLHAHAHKLMENDFFNNGIIYYGCDAMQGRSYLLFTVVNGSYEYEVIKF
jgi:Predicted phosphohydrolases